MRFTWKTGDRPLEGYTIKRGIGQGGFGEVYYAVSDGGKEVALKFLRGNIEVELRGVSLCLNLKHPNLVSIYDVRTDSQGDHWVIMEYIVGEPLSAVIQRHPTGMPLDLVRRCFAGLAEGVACLHEHGIVHRDLKPSNIFLENGRIKVGDYGLSKFINASHGDAQTQSVGTVYYMAPEISSGNYNKQIDIYAAGVILYEMLTGHVPFDGETAFEILMKHLTAVPDLSRLPADFRPVVARALAKNPAHRYASMAELARAVETAGQPATMAPAGTAPRYLPPTEPLPMVLPPLSTATQLGELAGSLALAPLVIAAMCAPVAALKRDIGQAGLLWIGDLFFQTLALTWVVLAATKFWSSRGKVQSLSRRGVLAALGAAVGLGALWLKGWTPPWWGDLTVLVLGGERLPGPTISAWPGVTTSEDVIGRLCYFGLGLGAIRWWTMTDRHRSHRFMVMPVMAAGFWGLLLLLFWRADEAMTSLLAFVLSAVAVQVVSPWEPLVVPVRRPARIRCV